MDIKVSDIILEILELFLSDLEDSVYPRKVERLTGMSHRSASLNLKKLSKLKVLREKKSGKENYYFLNVENSLTINFLCFAEARKFVKNIEMLPKKVKEVVKELQNRFSRLCPQTILGCVIFGSYAKGYYKEDSDLDLLILVSSKKIDEIEEINKDLTRIWGVEISPLFMTLSDLRKNLEEKNPTLMEIINNHLIVLGGENFLLEVIKWKRG